MIFCSFSKVQLPNSKTKSKESGITSRRARNTTATAAAYGNTVSSIGTAKSSVCVLARVCVRVYVCVCISVLVGLNVCQEWLLLFFQGAATRPHPAVGASCEPRRRGWPSGAAENQR